MQLPSLPLTARTGLRSPGQRRTGLDDQRQPSRGRGGLLLGLRHLQAGDNINVRRDLGNASPARLQPISAVSRRANECVEEADAGFSKITSEACQIRHKATRGGVMAKTDDPMVQGSEAASIAGAAAAFEILVTQIEDSLQGGDSSMRIVRNGQCRSERVPARGSRRYKIPLPNRPTELTISLNLTGGRIPSIWASTVDPVPCSNNHEFRGKYDKLVYKHVLPLGDADLGVDRRHTAPNSRELYVTIEATLGQCEYDMTVKFGHINIALTRQELSAQVAKLKMSWETRVHELQRDPLAREEFDSRLIDLREADAKKKRELAGGLNHVLHNKGNFQEWSPVSQRVGLHKRALQNIARHDECLRRRAELPASGRAELPAFGKTRRRLQQCGAAVCLTPIAAAEAPAVSLE